LSFAYIAVARPICLRFERHWVFRASSLARLRAGSNKPISSAMMTITASSSISVPCANENCAIHQFFQVNVPLATPYVKELAQLPGREIHLPGETVQ